MDNIRDIAKKVVSAISARKIVFATREELENNLYIGHYRDGDPKIRDYRKADSYGKTIDCLLEIIPNHIYFRKIEQERKIKIKNDSGYIKNLYCMRHLK